eukprot:scpid94459/ scgid35410/ 
MESTGASASSKRNWSPKKPPDDVVAGLMTRSRARSVMQRSALGIVIVNNTTDADCKYIIYTDVVCIGNVFSISNGRYAKSIGVITFTCRIHASVNLVNDII